MSFSAKWQNFCVEKIPMPMLYKHKISDCKPSGNDFFAVSGWKVFVSSFHPFNDPMETEPLEYSGHGRWTDIAQVLADIFSQHSKSHVFAPADRFQYLKIWCLILVPRIRWL